MADIPILEPLASIESLALKTGGDRNDERLQLALDLASGRFREQANNPISMISETVILDSDGGRTLALPCLPVREVTALEIDGQPITDFEWSESGVIRLDRPIPDKWRSVEVTYRHGYAPVPKGIQDVVLEQAAAIYQTLPGLVSYTTGAEQRTYSSALTVGTTAQWAAMVARYKVD
jgi:hypothetical protein